MKVNYSMLFGESTICYIPIFFNRLAKLTHHLSKKENPPPPFPKAASKTSKVDGMPRVSLSDLKSQLVEVFHPQRDVQRLQQMNSQKEGTSSDQQRSSRQHSDPSSRFGTLKTQKKLSCEAESCTKYPPQLLPGTNRA